MTNAITHTTLVEAQHVLETGYKGIREDISIVMGWPSHRVDSIAAGEVPSGLRYGSKNNQAQAVVVVGKALIKVRAAQQEDQKISALIPLVHWWRLSPKVRSKIVPSSTRTAHEDNGSCLVQLPRHVAQLLYLSPPISNDSF